MTTYNNVLGVFSYAAHTLANTLWSERALTYAYGHAGPSLCRTHATYSVHVLARNQCVADKMFITPV